MIRRYTATAEREGRWWLIVVPGIGATQARTLADAEDMAEDMVAAMLDVPVEDVRVTVQPKLPDELVDVVSDARHLAEDAAKAARAARDAQALAARELRAAGLSGGDIGHLLGGVSKQRVSQLTTTKAA